LLVDLTLVKSTFWALYLALKLLPHRATGNLAEIAIEWRVVLCYRNKRLGVGYLF